MLNNLIMEQIKVFLNVQATIWPFIFTSIAGFLVGRIFITLLNHTQRINKTLAIFCFLLVGAFLVITQGEKALYSVYTTLGGVLLAEIIDQEKPRYFEIIIALLMMIGFGFFIMGGIIATLIGLICFGTSILLIKKIPPKEKSKQASETALKTMLEQVERLELEELQEMKQVIFKQIAKKEKTTKLTDIQKKLLAYGLVQKINNPTERTIVERKLVQVKGKPVSETIIEDRR